MRGERVRKGSERALLDRMAKNEMEKDLKVFVVVSAVFVLHAFARSLTETKIR